jgi:hypothetical protein
MWKSITFTVSTKLPTIVYYIRSKFSFCLPPLKPRAWYILYLFVNMLRSFLYTLPKSKFLHACIQPNGLLSQWYVHISWSRHCIFLYLNDLERCLFIIYFLKANRIKFSASPSLILQNLTHYQSKVISEFPQSESHSGSLGCEGLSVWL